MYYTLCRAGPLTMITAAAWPDVWMVRLGAAAWHSLYVLAETSCTHSHRDHASLYSAWALALLPAHLAHGVALGVCVHFVASSGFAKLHVAGGAAAWAEPSTLASILRQYNSLPIREGGPLLPRASALLVRHPLLVATLSAFTLVFECALVPAALLLPLALRPLLAAVSCMLHVGIAAVQSLDIGLYFLPNLGTYCLGFGSSVPLGSPGWWCAIAVCAASAAPLLVRRRLVAEDWPLTPFALFAWSGPQWRSLFARLVDGDTRLVLGARAPPQPGQVVVPAAGLEGRRPAAGAGEMAYDGWEQAVGETLVFNEVLRGLDWEAMAAGGRAGGWAPRLAVAVEKWLAGGRLVLAGTGEPLRYASVVSVRKEEGGGGLDVVCEVLATGKGEGKGL